MGETTTGANRLFGNTTMGRMGELRRQALVSSSEINEHIPADSDFPRTVSVQRKEQTSAGQPSIGLGASYSLVAGLTDITGHVRTNGRWKDARTGQRILLGDAERVVMLLDIPAGGNGQADELLTTDRLIFDDPIKGAATVWEVEEVYISYRDGIAVARCKYIREDY